jgi:hypothetical protein
MKQLLIVLFWRLLLAADERAPGSEWLAARGITPLTPLLLTVSAIERPGVEYKITSWRWGYACTTGIDAVPYR